MGSARQIIPVGPSFLNGKTRIGRSRLPPGIVAHLDQANWRLAVKDLYDYAVQSATEKMPYGIAFRIVEAPERDAINCKIQELLGVKNFAANSQRFCPPTGHLHLIDSEHIAHVCNRHSDPPAEQMRGAQPIVPADFELIADVAVPRNIQKFSMEGKSARIVYTKDLKTRTLVLVEEIRSKSIVFKTMYNVKK